MTFWQAVAVIFWGVVLLVFIVTVFSSVSNFTDGAVRRADRKQKRYYEENND